MTTISVDLGDDSWRRALVTQDGWSIAPHGEQLFRRAPGMMSLPEPVRGGNLTELREFVHVADNDDFALLVAFLVNAIRHRGPYPILLLTGEQGSAKTTTARILRRLVDPNKADVRAEARDNRDLAIAANNGHMIALDNLSHLSPQVSDALCRLSTGGGFSTRTLYTDSDETIFDGQRPIVLTSIVDVASRADLLDRCLIVRLQPIPERERRTERELWSKFDEAHPRLFGALLDAVVAALRNVGDIDRNMELKPRMADAYCWALAAAPALGIDASVITQAWYRTRDEAYASTIEASLIAGPLRKLIMNAGGEWAGTASMMLAGLEADDATKRRKEWPKSAKALAGNVRVIAPGLRSIGIDHTEDRGAGTGARLHSFKTTESAGAGASHASHASQSRSDQREFRDASATRVTQGPDPNGASVTGKARNRVRCDARDDRDAKIGPLFPQSEPDVLLEIPPEAPAP